MNYVQIDTIKMMNMSPSLKKKEDEYFEMQEEYHIFENASFLLEKVTYFYALRILYSILRFQSSLAYGSAFVCAILLTFQ